MPDKTQSSCETGGDRDGTAWLFKANNGDLHSVVIGG